MSGTYAIDGDLFIQNPLNKSWRREQIGTTGQGSPIFSNYWELDLSFGNLRVGSGSAAAYLMEKYLAGGLHSAVLPHPQTGFLTTFSGVAITDVNFTLTDIDRDRWSEGGRMVLNHISLSVSWEISGQPQWWF